MIEIGGLHKTTLIDYPGCVAATVFLIGCNFRCPFCYASELVLPGLNKNQPRVSEEELFAFLKERKGLLDGVVICGGEPTINEDLSKFIKKIKQLGFLVKLDTNGSNPAMLKKIIEEKLVDYVAMDVKTNTRNYDDFVAMYGALEKIKESIAILKSGQVNYEFRTTVVPDLHSKEDVVQVASWLRGAKKFCLQGFRPEKTIDPKFEEINPHPQEFLEEIKKEVAPYFEICEVRG